MDSLDHEPSSSSERPPGARPARIRWILVAVVLAVTGWWLMRPPPGPRIQGFPVSAWLEALAGRPAQGMEPEDLRQAGAAIEKLGAPAYPALERALLDARPVGRWLLTRWLRLPAAVKKHLRPPVAAETLRRVTLEMIQGWAPESRLALARQLTPRVIARIRQSAPPERAPLISGVLHELKPEIDDVLPFLRECLREASPETPEAALGLLLDYGKAALPALPELTALIGRTNCPDRVLAVQLLGRIGPDARPAVGPLEGLLGSGLDDVLVAQALWSIDRQTNTALRHLTNAVEDRSGNVAFTLGTMGPAGRPAVPFLLAALASRDGNVRMNAARALRNIAPEHLPLAVAAVAGALTNGLAARSSDLDAQGAAWYAATVLREFGRDAAPARAALERGARSPREDLAGECRRALEALDAVEGGTGGGPRRR